MANAFSEAFDKFRAVAALAVKDDKEEPRDMANETANGTGNGANGRAADGEGGAALRGALGCRRGGWAGVPGKPFLFPGKHAQRSASLPLNRCVNSFKEGDSDDTRPHTRNTHDHKSPNVYESQL